MFQTIDAGTMKKISILFLIGTMVFSTGCSKTENAPNIVIDTKGIQNGY